MSFRDVIQQHGHKRIVELLVRSASRGTLPPSLIFSGPRGAGKHAMALAVAQALNCLQPQSDGDACGVCQACVRIARGVHADVFIAGPGDSGSIKIDPIRDLIEQSGYRPFEGKRRVFIVDDADMLVVAAQNALLKTLEEPPASSVFILTTTRPDVLLATVRSRCIRLTFREHTPQETDPDALAIAVRTLVHAAAGEDSRRLEGAKELLTGTGGGAGAAEDRERVRTRLRAAGSLLRDIEVVSTNADVELNGSDDASLQRLVQAYKGRRGVEAYAAIDAAIAAVDANVGIKIVADWLVLQV
ncbi:MAG TPA: AAA family ATPase [Vicinamibacterales bacterium]